MAEILAIPASVIALVQAVELAQIAVSKISDLKNAPAEVVRIGDELNQVLTIVQQVGKYAQENDTTATNEAATMLHAQISTLKSDLDRFLGVVQPHLCQGTTWARLKTRTKWAMGLDKRLAQISKRISAHGGRLLIALSLYSRCVSTFIDFPDRSR